MPRRSPSSSADRQFAARAPPEQAEIGPMARTGTRATGPLHIPHERRGETMTLAVAEPKLDLLTPKQRSVLDEIARYPIIDVDSHISEPGDLWTSRVSKKWGDLVPHVKWAEDRSSSVG